ncbi:MAG: hypothetical protein Q8L64_06040 [bacterium]|nr:hypothetical protein [bacterium]
MHRKWNGQMSGPDLGNPADRREAHRHIPPEVQLAEKIPGTPPKSHHGGPAPAPRRMPSIALITRRAA